MQTYEHIEFYDIKMQKAISVNRANPKGMKLLAVKISRFNLRIVLPFICLVTIFACRSEKSQSNISGQFQSDTTKTAEVQRDSRLQRITIAGVPLFVETAQTDDQRMRGLMYRESLPRDQGMLFVFPAAQIQSFWMRNTFIPLDIAFINSDGIIVDIQHMKPVDESVLYTSSAPALYALEVNAGWFEKNGIQAGASVKF